MPTRIMLVEDESIVALNLQRRLIGLGYEVPCIAASHDEAIQGISETQPDLVLMDININGDIDGIDTAAEIAVPVIYLTAYSEEKTLARARATKPFGYLIKPFSERELHATIQMALERHRIETRLLNSEQQLAIAYAKAEEARRELEKHAAELFRERERLQVTLNSIGDGVITTDQLGRVTYLNPVAEAMTGRTNSAACGLLITDVLVLVDEETRTPDPLPVTDALRQGQLYGLAKNSLLIGANGTEYAIQDSVAPIRDHDGKVIGTVLVFHDVSDARRLASEMTWQATHDALTGLANRREFERRMALAIENAELLGRQHALAYLDLDQFKIVNDTCGHAAGDELLRQVTQLLRFALRTNDTLARLGGDEFGVLLEACPAETALQIAQSLRNAVADFHFSWNDRVFPVSVSIGLVSFGGKAAGFCMTLKEIMSTADAACYTAKDLGRNRIHVYRPDDYILQKHYAEMNWHGRIHQALEQNRLVLYVQDIVSLEAPDLEGSHHDQQHVEVLVRLKDEAGKLVLPMAFMPAATRYGLMLDIDRWVIRHALEAIAALPKKGAQLFSINLSAETLNDKASLAFIKDCLQEAGVSPACICFEVTETSAIANLLNASAFIRALQTIGCQFSLDDFGSGMSSFSYLKHLPVNYLKIDGVFVKGMAKDPIDEALVDAINKIAHVMGMKTIAEYAENGDILEKLRAMGVNYAQGYGVGRTRPIERLSKAR